MKPVLRASELDRVLSCNGSLTLVPMVAPRDSDEGYEGTAIHHAIATRLINELGAHPPDGGLPPADVPKGYRIPANSLWIVDWCFRHVQETVDPEWSLLAEIGIAYEFDRWILSGHIDYLSISPDGTESRGGDYKTGRDPIDPADNNEQVGGYLVNQKRAWDTLTKATFDILQPRLTEDDEFERVSSVTVDNLDALVTTLDARVCRAIDNRRELNSGKKQCAWCPVGCQCFALQGDQKLMKIQMTDAMLAKIKKTPDDAVLGDWVATAKTMERANKDAVEMLHKRIDELGVVTSGSGVTITRKVERGSYEVPDPLVFLKAVQTLLPSSDMPAQCYTPSMTKIKNEIAVVLNCPKTGQAPVTAESIFDAHLRPLVKQGERRILQFT